MTTSSGNGLLQLQTDSPHQRDEEAGPSKDDNEVVEDLVLVSDPFDIAQTKHQAALVLNASRRFRYTLDLKKEEEKENRRRMIRAHAQVIRAALLFKLAAEDQTGIKVEQITPPTPSGDYGIGLEQLASITRDHNFSALEHYGGVKGLSDLLKTNLDTGVVGDDTDLSKRRNSFGSNTYPLKKGRSFLRFLWEAWQDLTLIILIVAAIASLVLGIKTEGVEEGWYDGASIAFAVFLVIIVTAISDYRQSLQFQNLNKEKRNIQLEVPADGIVVTGHSLAIDESSMTGESKIVRKDHKAPFLMSGCKVADGVGTMLVTGVGINTEWGLLMASISEDTGEETPLQVRLNGVATFIGIFGLAVAVLVLAVLLVRFFTGNTSKPDGSPQFVKGRTSIGDAVDGVIKIVTIAVRRLSACETMGSATTICSDKTGTLTLNQLGMKFDIVKSETTVLHVFPFNSEKKRGGVALKRMDSEVHIHWKGAAEIVLASCTRYLDSNGHLQSIDEEKDLFMDAINEMAARSLRCVAIAYRSFEMDKVPSDEESLDQWVLPEDDLVLLAIVGIKDPCRPGVRDAVKICKEAGVKVRMVTGDNLQTAKAIALECGILDSIANVTDYNIIEGKVFREFSEKEREQVAAEITVVRWGRSVFANIQKFIQFQLTVNVAALVINVVAAISSGDVPLNAVQVITPFSSLLNFHIPWEPLITNIMWRNLLVQAAYQVTVLLVLNFLGIDILHLKEYTREHAISVKNTMIFNTFVLCQVFNEFNARKPDEFNVFRGVTKNYLFIGIIVITVVLQILIIEFLGKFTETVQLDWHLWLASVLIGIVRSGFPAVPCNLGGKGTSQLLPINFSVYSS
ncbi:hypothetical protein EZV62_004468 [Acer yangbiense]|uniref:P-type Cu(+) transporter n=1 Tax=Acer yangbiense TaxID=1000413 RepID=A0A5C7IJS8_9ROSI|nr:hypothetical protein EZV62_004468 [Acer yangbiense]